MKNETSNTVVSNGETKVETKTVVELGKFISRFKPVQLWLFNILQTMFELPIAIAHFHAWNLASDCGSKLSESDVEALKAKLAKGGDGYVALTATLANVNVKETTSLRLFRIASDLQKAAKKADCKLIASINDEKFADEVMNIGQFIASHDFTIADKDGKVLPVKLNDDGEITK